MVVNNALARYQFNPSSSMASVKTVSTEDLEQQMKGTLAGAVNMVQAALPSFEAAKFGTRGRRTWPMQHYSIGPLRAGCACRAAL